MSNVSLNRPKKRIRLSTSPIKNTSGNLVLQDTDSEDEPSENLPSKLNLRGLARQEIEMSKKQDSYTMSQSSGREFAKRRLF